MTAAFFAKLDPIGTKIVYAGALPPGAHQCVGGSSCFLQPLSIGGAGIAVDSSGNAYIAADTNGAWNGRTEHWSVKEQAR